MLVGAPPTPHGAIADFARLRGGAAPWLAGTVRAVSDESPRRFVSKYLPLRDVLAWRAARGLDLTAVERAALRSIDVVLDELDPGSAPLPTDVAVIVRDVLRDR